MAMSLQRPIGRATLRDAATTSAGTRPGITHPIILGTTPGITTVGTGIHGTGIPGITVLGDGEATILTTIPIMATAGDGVAAATSVAIIPARRITVA